MAWVAWSPLDALTLRSSDDAYYYFQVARNWTAGLGPTFDGMHPTNGFHPLWMLLLLPIYAMAGADPILALRAVFCVVVLIAGATVWVAYRVLSWHAGRAPAAATLLLFASPPFLNPMVNGLETGILLLISFLFLDLAARRDLLRPGAGAANDALLGALLGLLFLARLDSVFLVIAAFTGIVARWAADGVTRAPLGALVTKLARTGAVAAAYALPYLVWNHSQFGHWMPISGALKNAFPEWSLSWDHLAQYHGRYGLAQIVLASFMIAAVALLHRSRAESGAPPRLSAGLLVFLAGCTVHFANTLAFLVWGVHWWHFAGYVPLTLVAIALGLSMLADRVTRSRSVNLAASLACVAFVVVAHRVDRARRGEQHATWLRAAEWAQQHLPREAVVAMSDCGLFGYLSGRRTVNLDGVINGYEYQDALRDHRLANFLDRAGVTHVATHAARYENGEYLVWLPSHLYRTEGGAILGNERAEVYRSLPYDGVYFVIWDRRKVRVLDDVDTVTRTAGTPAPTPAPTRS